MSEAPECVVCGKPAPGARYGPRARYPSCSELCSKRLRRVLQTGHPATFFRDRRCVICDGPIPAERPTDSRFCSHRCHNRKRRREGRICEECGKPIPETKRSHARHCSRKCTQRAINRTMAHGGYLARGAVDPLAFVPARMGRRLLGSNAHVSFVCALLAGLPNPAARVRWLEDQMPAVLVHLTPAIRDRIAIARTALYLRRRRLPTPIHQEDAA